MEKCLVNQLKGAVEDNTLPVFGQLTLKVKKLGTTPANSQCKLALKTDKSLTVSVTSPGYFATSYAGLNDPATRLTNLTLSPGLSYLWFANENYDILIDGKYDITFIENDAGSSSAKGTIVADLEDLAYLTKTTGVRFAFSDSIGDIKALARLTSMSEMVLAGSLCYGSVEEFVAGQVANGREIEDAGIYCFGLLNMASFGGSIQGVSGAQLLTWKSASNIAIFNAATIEGATTVYAKGATAEEIAAWEGEGKTVVVVS